MNAALGILYISPVHFPSSFPGGGSFIKICIKKFDLKRNDKSNQK